MRYRLLHIILLAFSIHLSAQEYVKYTNIPYQSIAGVDQQLLSLDIYVPQAAQGLLPVVFYVHGGAWYTGDKSATHIKDRFFTAQDYVFVSVNYRLSPECLPCDTISEDAIRYPTQGEDVAKALSWVIANISDYHGDPSKIGLIGHSAGAHLVSIVSTDQRLLQAYGQSIDSIDCTCSLDAGVLDLPTQMSYATSLYKLTLINAFTSDPEKWIEASPAQQVEEGEKIPAFLLVHQDKDTRIWQNENFEDSLLKYNNKVKRFPVDLTHGEINFYVGVEDSADFTSLTSNITDELSDSAYEKALALTKTVKQFFSGCFFPGQIVHTNRELTLGRKIICYPNPVKDILYIQSFEAIERIELYSIDGRKLKDFRVENQTMMSLDLSGISNKILFVRATDSRGRLFTKKVLLGGR